MSVKFLILPAFADEDLDELARTHCELVRDRRRVSGRRQDITAGDIHLVRQVLHHGAALAEGIENHQMANLAALSRMT